ncbi:Inosine-uridine preferring nucleoside hydrolase [Taphrina deformans PYCC 5710]|uniref:Inosine-uridine preferring nucleoside hydrolase n=1 Tax=Taphrina deformans (strain PYCC 5710 / ATCC 11124 / CBS 356.35 / IMI 108563 / JCM 9778 / NBRC 8474) TaxID=1097556 RepID=R4XGP4_TAPDE|nr:Inosine-uridine preferring nucleoside hydrolase [Taphrina deformans PYCC 5710]|eukprot:CCG83647.1 Inosine-uridine preferring nucleoside hydrolase [Taphrina deformans PYCC 5710]
MSRRRVIIDTDPGVDDVLALLYALASSDLHVLAITTVHGNIDLTNTTRNTISLFNVLYDAHTSGQSTNWIDRLFEEDKITLAAGAKTPLVPEAQLDASYFHGRDGLGGVSDVYPQYLPEPGWESSFPSLRGERLASTRQFAGLVPAQREAHDEILDILAREEADTVTIVALGPLTNLSLAMTKDDACFCRTREVVIMGGALRVPGNVTPKSEFNFMADPESASHVLSYSSPTPSSTHPTSPLSSGTRLRVTLLPLDTTTAVSLSHGAWRGGGNQGTVLKRWCDVFVERTFANAQTLYSDTSIEKLTLSMHDPSCIWYLLHSISPTPTAQQWHVERDVDVRVECTGTWTRGACVVDDRGRERILEGVEERAGSDEGGWLHRHKGNRDAMGAIFG